MEEEKLRKIFLTWARERDLKLGDMSEYSETEIEFLCFAAGFEYAISQLKTGKIDDEKASYTKNSLV